MEGPPKLELIYILRKTPSTLHSPTFLIKILNVFFFAGYFVGFRDE